MSLSKIVALGTGIYHHYGLEAALKGIRRAGCGYVEMAANPPHAGHVSPDMDDAAVEALLAKLQQYSLKVVALNGNIGMMRKSDVERSKRLISLAPKLGAAIMVNTVGGAGLEEDLPPFLANVGEVADHARKNGVTIGLEVHGKHTANGKLALDTVRAVNDPNVKINYDTANCIYFGDTLPYEDLQVAVPEMAHIHLKDKIGGKGVWNFPPIGTGEIDFEKVLNILDDGGYRGALSVEIEFDDRGWPPVAEVDEAASSAYRNLMRLLEAH